MADLSADGWCVRPQCLPRALLERVRVFAEARADADPPERRAAQAALGTLVSVFDDPRFAALIAAPELTAALAAAGLTDLRLGGGYFLSKPPGSPPTFWHQDWYFWDDPSAHRAAAPQVGAMIYLADTRADNGALRVLPGSHRRRHPLHAELAREEITALRSGADPRSPAFAAQPDEVTVPVQRGDLVLLDARCLHAAHANASASRRTVVTLWLMPDFAALSEPVQAFVAQAVRAPPGWPAEARQQLAPLLPVYEGAASPATLQAHPGPELR